MTPRVSVLALVYQAKKCFSQGQRVAGFCALEVADRLLPSIDDPLDYLDACHRIDRAYKMIYSPALCRESLENV